MLYQCLRMLSEEGEGEGEGEGKGGGHWDEVSHTRSEATVLNERCQSRAKTSAFATHFTRCLHNNTTMQLVLDRSRRWVYAVRYSESGESAM